ncbi:DUF3887 domain-containing protein [Rhodanobacter sp. C01]|uniref:DUF3887 domain-containing protein n=1 Tax=Rhodanobacter sp. C01 TaxID=1945856 RepID=UPI000984920B|nr:DUF3887 domain-containing protein [Rhodanobacter sp. C01]OOG48017.1 hypothetical protein B0E50_11420 [Rhodanobacter sp. C01]
MMKSAFATCIALGLGVAGMAHAATPDCQVTSVKMLDHLDQADYAGATADFNDRMKAALGADKLAKVWPAVAQQFGARGARGQARLSEVGGYALVVTPLHYGGSLIDAQVACDANGKVAGFHIKPEH